MAGIASALACEKRVRRWETIIKAEAAKVEVPAAVVAAIITRETAALDKFCNPPKKDGTGGQLGDSGYGHGPMQIDKRSFPVWCEAWRSGNLTIEDGIRQGCLVLKQKLKALRVLVPEIPEELRLRAAIAAYNCGEGNVRKAFRAGKDIDTYTTGKDYSKDVLERASYYAAHGFEP